MTFITHKPMKIDKPEVQDRYDTTDDEKKRVLDLYDMNLPVPVAGIFDEPTRCYQINVEWASIVMGLVTWLTEIASWKGANDETFTAIQEISKFLQGSDCMDCLDVISCLESDSNYLSLSNVTLANMEQTTQNFIDDLNAQYDGSTVQSIDADIPAGAPSSTEKTALCHAIGAWLNQYAQAKIAKLRSKNSLSQFWNDIQSGIVNAYGGLNNVLGFILPDDLFACFVDDDEAITVLSDGAALEAFHCCLYDELYNVALLTTSLDGAINACVGSLGGNAGKIACVVDNDFNNDHALNFYYIYGKSLERQASGTVFDCPCVEIPENWAYEIDLTQALPAWVQIVTGTWVDGVGVQNATAGSPASSQVNIQFNLNEAYSMRQVSTEYERSSDGSTFDNLRVVGFTGAINNQRTDWLEYDEPIHGYQLSYYCNPIPGIASAARTNWLFSYIDYAQPSNPIIVKKIKFWTDLQLSPPSPLPNNSTPDCLP